MFLRAHTNVAPRTRHCGGAHHAIATSSFLSLRRSPELLTSEIARWKVGFSHVVWDTEREWPQDENFETLSLTMLSNKRLTRDVPSSPSYI